MRGLIVCEAPHNVEECIRLSNVAQKSIAQTLTLARTSNEPRDIHKTDVGRCAAFGFKKIVETLQPVVRHFNDTYVWIYCAEGVVGGLCLSVRKGIEKRGFPHVRQADDSNK